MSLIKSVEKTFAYAHLPEHLQQVSKPYHDLAVVTAASATENNSHEVEHSLRCLLTAKDSAVRAIAIK